MRRTSNKIQAFNPFNRFLGLLSLLAIALYFTGWIYRWFYYDFFQLEVTTLNLPFESFYLAAFQVLFGHPFSCIRTIIAILVSGFIIIFILKIRKKLSATFRKSRLFALDLLSTNKLEFLESLIDELLIILLILTSLFWIARWQANIDAWKDAVNETSFLPVVTVVIPETGGGLGRKTDNPIVDPSGFRIIGDQNLYSNLLGNELTNTEDSNQARVWRLLLDRDSYFYIFPTLPRKDKSLSFPVLIIHENSNQFTILSSQVAM